MEFYTPKSRSDLEEGSGFAPKFDDRGLIPVTTTCVKTGGILMQAWMDAEAIKQTLITKEAHYFSRSRQELWHKGATSGEIQKVINFKTDCDQDSLWLIVEQMGEGCCHVGYPSCFYREISLEDEGGRLETTLTKK
ncbi:phosphoribosyl-AMP cyclohydrolase [Temperatibacter marinus]|uniref:Histidine biosynthesis bifunctional protein HisIE n=1 Tax=Temperatibacter marinus TaxID=1456591 RepID=A0AA52HAK4_9PROT|nr:phosphoribosyl-AMP cyclohydrolase [Temperatibacter marinus]WND02693.1 phosphoribosyl-AMP cyclohydrolase [Temperatibacter marinus]